MSTTGMSAGRPSARTGASAAKLQSIIGGGDDDKLVRVNFEIPKGKHRALKAYAVAHDKSLRELFEEYIDTLIDER